MGLIRKAISGSLAAATGGLSLFVVQYRSDTERAARQTKLLRKEIQRQNDAEMVAMQTNLAHQELQRQNYAKMVARQAERNRAIPLDAQDSSQARRQKAIPKGKPPRPGAEKIVATNGAEVLLQGDWVYVKPGDMAFFEWLASQGRVHEALRRTPAPPLDDFRLCELE